MSLRTFILRNMSPIPRNGKVDGYPLDLDGAERHTRFKTGIDFWPIQTNATDFAKLGQVNGFMPQQDQVVWAQGYGKEPSGPIVSILPINLQWQMTIPGLNKQTSL